MTCIQVLPSFNEKGTKMKNAQIRSIKQFYRTAFSDIKGSNRWVDCNFTRIFIKLVP